MKFSLSLCLLNRIEQFGSGIQRYARTLTVFLKRKYSQSAIFTLKDGPCLTLTTGYLIYLISQNKQNNKDNNNSSNNKSYKG